MQLLRVLTTARCEKIASIKLPANLHSVAQFKSIKRATIAECDVPRGWPITTVHRSPVGTTPHPIAMTDTSVTTTTALPPSLLPLMMWIGLFMLLLLVILMTVMINGEAAAALTDVHGDVVGVSLVTAGPRKAWSEAQYLVVFRPQRILLLPTVHPRIDDGHLVLGVEQHVLAALGCRVDELKGESAGRHHGDVGQVAVPVLVGDEVTLVDARLRRCSDGRRRH